MAHRRENDQREARRARFQEHRSPLGKNVQIYIKNCLLGEHFRSHVFRAATIRVSNLVLINVRLGKPKVSDLDISLKIKQNVLKLDISE